MDFKFLFYVVRFKYKNVTQIKYNLVCMRVRVCVSVNNALFY